MRSRHHGDRMDPARHWCHEQCLVIMEGAALILAIQKLFVNTLRPRQNGRHFADDIFKCIFLNENVWISIKISLKFVPNYPINNIPSFVQIMAWRRPGDKPLSEAMMVNLTTHICVSRPQWVKKWWRIILHTVCVSFAQPTNHTGDHSSCQQINRLTDHTAFFPNTVTMQRDSEGRVSCSMS